MNFDLEVVAVFEYSGSRTGANDYCPGPAVRLTAEFDRELSRDRNDYKSHHDSHPVGECHKAFTSFRFTN